MQNTKSRQAKAYVMSLKGANNIDAQWFHEENTT